MPPKPGHEAPTPTTGTGTPEAGGLPNWAELAATIAEGVAGGITAASAVAAEQARQAAAVQQEHLLADARRRTEAEQAAMRVKNAAASDWVEAEEAKRLHKPGGMGPATPHFTQHHGPAQPGNISEVRGTPVNTVGGYTRSGPPGTERPISGIVVSGTGVIGTAENARRLREPHARDGVTAVPEALDVVRDAAEVAFTGVVGFIRKRRVGADIATALAHSREADVATEAAASVVHARKPAPGLEADTGRQERLVRRAVDTVEDQQFANAMVRRNTYLLRAAAKQNGIKGTRDQETDEWIDVNRMSAEQLADALRAPGTRLTGSARKVLRVAGKRLGAAQEHAGHAAHKLHETAEGHTREARVRARLADNAIGRARKAVNKQAAKERGKAAGRDSLGGSEGRRMR